jgi:hypothetical protein
VERKSRRKTREIFRKIKTITTRKKMTTLK